MKVCANTPQNEASSIRNSWTPSISSMARRLNQVAIPAIILFNLSNLPGADGGPISYAACVGLCAALAPPVVVACAEGCLPLLYYPFSP